jgi:hypothetical protein
VFGDNVKTRAHSKFNSDLNYSAAFRSLGLN